VHDDWYQGTADAVFQNFQSIEAEAPELTLILAGDHIYKMNYGEMLECHRHYQADITNRHPSSCAGGGGPVWHRRKSTPPTVSWASKRNRSTATQALEFQSRHGERVDGDLRVRYRRAVASPARGRRGYNLESRFPATTCCRGC